jgi:hypothetical protein
MSAAAWLASAALVMSAALAVALLRTRARLARLETTSGRLEELVHRELEPGLAAVRADARRAQVTARDAAIAAGVTDPPPRLPLEPVTGRVVRAVAFGAGARRALARVATPPWAARARRSA